MFQPLMCKQALNSRYGHISQCSSVDEGVYVPAADVTVTTVQGLLALRNAIDDALRYDMPQQAEPNA